ncbi:MAG: DNA topology modulation protein [Bacteroidota bacterium]
MQRILVIGSGGAGKSTLARQLGRRLGLPVIHLDQHYWQPGWVETPRAVWQERVRQLIQRERWVMDGNYSGTMEMRLAAADTIVFLDTPRWRCLWQATRRYLRFRGRSRPDMSPGCPERLPLAFLWWIWRYPRARRPGLLARLQAVEPSQRVVVVRSTREARRFLNSVSPMSV